MYSEEARTKLTIFLKCVLRKQKEKIKPGFYQNVLVFFSFKDIKMVCGLIPYEDVLVFSAEKHKITRQLFRQILTVCKTTQCGKFIKKSL